jgi:hypothetical protein
MMPALFCLTIAAIALVCSCSAPAEPIHIGSEKQLFLGPWAEDGRDDYLVESMRNVTMTMNEAHVTGERMIPHGDKPWDLGDVWLSVIKDEDEDGVLFRMYYNSRDWEAWQPRTNPYSLILLYAESRDGVNWERPNLRLWEWEGSRDNNILFPNDDFPYVFRSVVVDSVFIDPNAASPEEKYKMVLGHMASLARPQVDDPDFDPDERPAGFLYPREGVEAPPLPTGKHVFSSPDGIHWKLMSHEDITTGAGDAKYSVVWDARIGKYVQWTRIKPPNPELVQHYKDAYGVDRPSMNIRMIGRAESDDLLNWTEGQIVLAPDEIDNYGQPVWMNRLDFYGPNIRPYGEGAAAYTALPPCQSHWPKWRGGHPAPPEGRTGGGGWGIDVQLATSRDGINWNRAPDRRPFIRNGIQGTFWSRQIYPSGDIIEVGDELWFYFGASALGHGAVMSPDDGGIGRAVLRRDGFISADADYTGGELITWPLVFTGSKLQLNTDTGSGGTVRVELLDEAGRPIPGFELKGDFEDVEIEGNHICVIAQWPRVVDGVRRYTSDVSELAGRPVRLRFAMRNARLYSFQFSP